MIFLLIPRKKVVEYLVAVLLRCLVLAAGACGQSVDVIKFAFKDLPAELQNPLTGFYPYGPVSTDAKRFPVAATLEYIALPLNSVLIRENTYNWASFEQKIAQISRNGRQSVVRFYLDNPGLPSGIPQFLVAQGLSTKPYRQNGNCATCSRIPDYSNARLLSALLGFIKEFGTRFNADRRIGIVQLGLVGFWGEWHTWPLEYTAETFPSTEVQAQILKTFHDYFPDTLLQVGINVASLAVYNGFRNSNVVKSYRIGYSDDSIFNNYYSTYIRPILTRSNTTNKFLSTIIGGEVFPPIQNCVLQVPSCVGSPGQLLEMIKAYRASVALFERLFTGTLSDAEVKTATLLSKSMGYRYYVDSVNAYMYANGTEFTITVANNGITRPYFKLYLGLDVDRNCYFVTKFLHELGPDETFEYFISIPFVAPKLAFRARFFLHAPEKVMPSQILYLSNEGINNYGDLYFSINSRPSLALPWFKRNDVV